MGTGQQHVPPAAGIRHDHRRAMLVALAFVVAVLLAVALTQAVGGGSTTGSPAAQPAAQPAEGFPPSPVSPFGLRYDGGPEEGSRGAGAGSRPNPGRPDGGPEEGTRGLGH